jgi:hypothetical protein
MARLRTILALALFAAPLLAAPALAAVGNYPYGSVVSRADFDYSPFAVARAASLCFVDDDGSGAFNPGEWLFLNVDAAACDVMSEGPDVRLNDHGSYLAGSLVRASDAVRWQDMAGTGEWDGKQTAYIDTNDNGKVGVGDVRLTKSGDFPPGSTVKNGDPDINGNLKNFGAAPGRHLSDVNAVFITGGGGTFKASRAIYLNVDGGTPAADIGVEANDIRLGGTIPQPFGGKADVRPLNIAFAPPEPGAGEAFQLTLDVRNDGKGTGFGMVSTKINGLIVDSRTTPTMDPGDKVTLVMTLVAPSTPGAANLTAGDVNVLLNVKPGTDAQSMAEAVAQAAALQQRVDALASEVARGEASYERAAEESTQLIAALRAQVDELVRERAALKTTSVEPTKAAVPGFEVLALVGAAALVAVAARRWK